MLNSLILTAFLTSAGSPITDQVDGLVQAYVDAGEKSPMIDTLVGQVDATQQTIEMLDLLSSIMSQQAQNVTQLQGDVQIATINLVTCDNGVGGTVVPDSAWECSKCKPYNPGISGAAPSPYQTWLSCAACVRAFPKTEHSVGVQIICGVVPTGPGSGNPNPANCPTGICSER